MSTGTHTPGPWLLHDDLGVTTGDGVAVIAQVIGPDEACVSPEQAQADARLIAAAPDLLAVARRAKAWIEDAMEERGWPRERVENPPEGSHLHAINAAIAKATGVTE